MAVWRMCPRAIEASRHLAQQGWLTVQFDLPLHAAALGRASPYRSSLSPPFARRAANARMLAHAVVADDDDESGGHHPRTADNHPRSHVLQSVALSWPPCVPSILADLKASEYKVVHLEPKQPIESVPVLASRRRPRDTSLRERLSIGRWPHAHLDGAPLTGDGGQGRSLGVPRRRR
jgi:hypothetical protein